MLDGFAQSQGHLSLTDARYLNAMKLFLQGVTPLEYAAHRNFAYLARHLDGPGPRFAALCQSDRRAAPHADRDPHDQQLQQVLRRVAQLRSSMHDRVWYLSVPKSFFDDAHVGGPVRVPHRDLVLASSTC